MIEVLGFNELQHLGDTSLLREVQIATSCTKLMS